MTLISRPLPDAADALPDHISDTVKAIAFLHEQHRADGARAQLLIERLTWSAARPGAIAVILLIAAAWIGLNLALPALGRPPLDPAPFFWLQGAVAFTALMMTILILTTQRREDQLIELREQLILELAILADQKAAKTIELLESLRRDLPSVRDRTDATADLMSAPADPSLVAEALKEARPDRPPRQSGGDG
ncbi:DUF1003 domain-containing protein [Phenylobacterium sp.]|uniref:DUF1003 domain-containing protein n=1 Tax=Phenylobacterium sp. TaxID=1871053 RepID=UPI0039834501